MNVGTKHCRMFKLNILFVCYMGTKVRNKICLPVFSCSVVCEVVDIDYLYFTITFAQYNI